MIKVNVKDETSSLETVILGIASDFGGTPDLEECYDPKSRENVSNQTFPVQQDIIREMNDLFDILVKYDVNVLRPSNISDLNQVFVRDIGFVIDETFIVPNIIKDRSSEIRGVSKILEQIVSNKVFMPKEARLEGGDLILFHDYIFIGYSKLQDFEKFKVSRTNQNGVNFIHDHFQYKTVKSFELNKSDIDPFSNALHLDCCFQPIGKSHAILCKQGFKNLDDIDFIINLFGEDNIILISQEEMYRMCANVFSISEKVLISESSFVRINNILRDKGFIVEEVTYSEVSKMGGLFRCSTLPLLRR